MRNFSVRRGCLLLPTGRKRPIIFLLGLLFLSAACSSQEQGSAPVATVAPAASTERKAPASLDLMTAIEQVAQNTIPAVVHIEVTERQEIPNPFLPFENDPFFRQFFGGQQPPKKFKREVKGLGSGMVMDGQGYILTNNHVAGGATKIEVLLADGERLTAKLVGADTKTDLAVIRIEPDGSLPHVVFGDSDQVKVGEWVVAIGHPRGLDQTVTQGIISAKHRTGIMDPSSYQDYLQTDAAINPGNSGGPLLNLRGEVIGVNSAIESTSGGFEGIGFAIPSNMALHVAQQLIAHGKVERGWLGVSIQDLTPQLARSFGLEKTGGALIADVVKGGPAERAGLQRGDVVVAFGGKEIADASALRNAVAVAAIGQNVALTLLRDGKRQELTVVIGDLKEAVGLLAASIEKRLGVEVQPVPAKNAENFGLEAGQGVEIVRIDPAGPLAEAGFEKGDMILEVNSQPVTDVEGLAAVVKQLQPKQKVVLHALDHRSGRTGYVQVTVR